MKKMLLLLIPFGLIALSSMAILKGVSQTSCLRNPGGPKTGVCMPNSVSGEDCIRMSNNPIKNCIGTVSFDDGDILP